MYKSREDSQDILLSTFSPEMWTWVTKHLELNLHMYVLTWDLTQDLKLIWPFYYTVLNFTILYLPNW